MGRNKAILLPKLNRVLTSLGENIKLARLRRKLSAEQIAERANLTRYVVSQIEKGSPAVSVGSYLQVLFVLGLESDLMKVAAEDALGRKLQDIELTNKKRAPKRAGLHGS
jgi:transcriptional regulator with XRE-family HTH domain